jgi:EAL domain-containing protein (putative c-di-GMP-specific phosphodiesterase class I)
VSIQAATTLVTSPISLADNTILSGFYNHLHTIEKYWMALQQHWALKTAEDMQSHLHRFSSEAQQNDLQILGRSARELDLLLGKIQQRGTPATSKEREKIHARLRYLKHNLDQDPQAQARQQAWQNQNHWENIIRQALHDDQFYLAYQPIVTLHGAPLEYYDVLLRMEGGTEGIAAAQFMPMAIKAGFSLQIDRWVIENALRSLHIQRDKKRPIKFFIRLSLAALLEADFLYWLRQKLATAEDLINHIMFDLPRIAVQKHPKAVEQLMQLCKKYHCNLLLSDCDDSVETLQLITDFDFKFIKISVHLMQTLTQHNDTLNRIQHIADHTHYSGKFIIAPFLEDAESLALLWGCQIDHIAGHFLQAPETQMNYDFNN